MSYSTRFCRITQTLLPLFAFLLLSNDLYAVGTKALWQSAIDSSFGNGQGIACIGDINGDGYNDVALGKPFAVYTKTGEGKIEIFLGSTTGLYLTPNIVLWGTVDELHFGHSIAPAGDVNNDGYADFVVGAPGNNTVKGRVFIYYGSSTGIQSNTVLFEEQSNSGYGKSLSSAGDVNQDGYSDIVVGAPEYSGNNKTLNGKVYLFTGSSSGINSSAIWSAEGFTSNSLFGSSVAGNGKYNNDNNKDLLVGAPSNSNGAGKVLLFTGNGSAYSANPLIFTNDAFGALYGHSVAWAGDIDHDGYSDVLVGSPRYSGSYTNEGKVYLYTSSADNKLIPFWTITGGQQNVLLGACVSAAGRFNNDTYDDIAYSSEANTTSSGSKLNIVYGNSTGLGTSTSAYTLDPGDSWVYFAVAKNRISSANTNIVAISKDNSTKGSGKLIAEEDRFWDKRGEFDYRTSVDFTISPNPSDNLTLARFSLTENTLAASLVVIDALGNIVAEVFSNQHLAAGQHDIPVRTEDLASGSYQILLQLDNRRVLNYPLNVLH